MVESNGDTTTHGKTDEQMSMAIENLRVMLATEDVDLVIQLLSDNNWDESAAASQYLAQQIEGESRSPDLPENRQPQFTDGD
jgi:glutamate synthase domain-containing protein 1